MFAPRVRSVLPDEVVCSLRDCSFGEAGVVPRFNNMSSSFTLIHQEKRRRLGKCKLILLHIVTKVLLVDTFD